MQDNAAERTHWRKYMNQANVSIFDQSKLNVIVETDGSLRQCLFFKLKSRALRTEFFGSTTNIFDLSDPSIPFLKAIESFDENTDFYFSMRFGPGSEHTGIDLARMTRSRFPNAKIYLVTSYPKEDYIDEYLAGVFNEMYEKAAYFEEPYIPENLTAEECKTVINQQGRAVHYRQFKSMREILAERDREFGKNQQSPSNPITQEQVQSASSAPGCSTQQRWWQRLFPWNAKNKT
jgi:hypothetical protein